MSDPTKETPYKEGDHTPSEALKKAEMAEEAAIKALEHGDKGAAEKDIRKAEHDLHKAEAEIKHPHKIEVTVDGKVKHIEGGIYLVNVFKADVGVPANKELDIVKDGVFHPLEDNAEIKIHPHEVFVSHVRTGASS